jgi:hypothetical protein
MHLKEINESENPEVPPPQIKSPGEISTQPQISRTLGRTSVPSPLFDLITIYDDEEISEVSLVTPVQIIEEKEPEKASTLGLNAPVQIHPQREYEVESALETNPLDIPGTSMERSRDDLGSSG